MDKVSNAVVVLLADFRNVALDDVLEQLVAPVPLVLLLLHLVDLGASEKWQLLCPWHQSNLFFGGTINQCVRFNLLDTDRIYKDGGSGRIDFRIVPSELQNDLVIFACLQARRWISCSASAS